MPYADRMDKNQTRSINFYCHMSKSANRKLAGMGISEGCPFRLIYKLKNVEKIITDAAEDDEDVFEVYKL